MGLIYPPRSDNIAGYYTGGVIMATNREALRNFLGPADMQYNLMQDLEPFFAIADAGVYVPAKATLGLWKEAKYAIECLGIPVTELIYVSWSDPLPERPDWMSDEGYAHLQELARRYIWGDTGDSFHDRLTRLYYRQYISSRTNTPLRDELSQTIDRDLNPVLRESLAQGLHDQLRMSFSLALEFFLSFACAGQTTLVERLRPIVRLLPKAIPLGEKKDQPGKWLLLVA